MTERMFPRMLAVGLTAVLLYGCTPSGTSLSGHFENSGGILFLDEITPEKTVVTLDTILLVNGNFNYRFKPEYEGIYRLRANDTSLLPFVAGGNDNLTFSGDARNLIGSYRVDGNISSQMLWETSRRVHEMYRLTDSLSRIFMEAQRTNSPPPPSLDSCYYTHFLACKSALAALIENHPSELAAISIFHQRIGVNRFFSEQNDSALYRMMKEKLVAAHPDNPHIKALQEEFEYE